MESLHAFVLDWVVPSLGIYVIAVFVAAFLRQYSGFRISSYLVFGLMWVGFNITRPRVFGRLV
jgi:hypothetical protein